MEPRDIFDDALRNPTPKVKASRRQRKAEQEISEAILGAMESLAIGTATFPVSEPDFENMKRADARVIESTPRDTRHLIQNHQLRSQTSHHMAGRKNPASQAHPASHS